MWHALYQYVLLPAIIFVAGYILLRMMGKKSAAEMSSIDILAVFVICSILSGPMISEKLGETLSHSTVFTLAYWAFSLLLLQPRWKRLLATRSTVLVRHGDIQEEGLHNVKMSVDQLMSVLRAKGYIHPADVEFAILEQTGDISVIPKPDKRPLLTGDIGLTVKPEPIPIPLIVDGEIISANLSYLKKSESWLMSELLPFGITQAELSKVTLAVLNENGSLRIDLPQKHEAEAVKAFT